MSLRQDLTHAARGLVREPGFTAVALLTLGLAIGANTAIFSVANSLLLKPLPLPQADRLVMLLRHFPKFETDSMSVPKFMFLREHTRREFSHFGAYDNLGSGFNLVGEGLPERLRATHVSGDFFPTLGAQPMLGRNFLPEEDRPGARRVLILSHRLWLRRFGGDPHILARHLELNGDSYEVIGVMPATFNFPGTAELWTPFGFDPGSTQIGNYFQIVGRLRDGVTQQGALAVLHGLRPSYDKAFPQDLGADETFVVRPRQERLFGRARPALLVLLAAVGAVLLIACVNVANLQLARAAVRQREIAIRSVLGATAGRIVRQLLTESVLLALCGGAAGLLVGALAIKPLVAMSPLPIDRVVEVGIDGRVLVFTLVLSLLSGVVFGLAPALQAARANLSAPLKEGSNRTAGSVGGRWVRRALVISEVALALVLITSAALLVRSFIGLVEIDAGFDSGQVLTMKLSLPAGKYGTAGAVERFGTAVIERVHGLPGVREAALAMSLPLEGGPDLGFQVVGRKGGGDDGSGFYDAEYRPATPDFFRVLRMPVLRGRGFTAADRAGAPLVVVINETAARRAFPHQNPIGERILIGPEGADVLADRGPRTIVGVVRDVRENGLDRDVPMVQYLPMAQVPDPLMKMFVGFLPVGLAVRSTAASAALTGAIEKQVWAVDPQQPITDVKTMGAIRAASLGSRRFTTVLLGLLALLALALASVGIYGVLSYLVSQRTREIGVRLALGASSSQVLQMVLRQGMAAVVAGIVIGLAGAFAMTRLLASQLYGVTARDPLTFALTPALLAVIAAFASSLPALRASRLDPLQALREE
jgi:putative ABC transport system permease protein